MGKLLETCLLKDNGGLLYLNGNLVSAGLHRLVQAMTAEKWEDRIGANRGKGKCWLIIFMHEAFLNIDIRNAANWTF